jgi:hypothetical protein
MYRYKVHLCIYIYGILYDIRIRVYVFASAQTHLHSAVFALHSISCSDRSSPSSSSRLPGSAGLNHLCNPDSSPCSALFLYVFSCMRFLPSERCPLSVALLRRWRMLQQSDGSLLSRLFSSSFRFILIFSCVREPPHYVLDASFCSYFFFFTLEQWMEIAVSLFFFFCAF